MGTGELEPANAGSGEGLLFDPLQETGLFAGGEGSSSELAFFVGSRIRSGLGDNPWLPLGDDLGDDRGEDLGDKDRGDFPADDSFNGFAATEEGLLPN